MKMFFRPEESHGASGIAGVLPPLCKGKGHVTDQTLRVGFQDIPIADLDVNRFTTVQTWGIYPDNLTWKKPADRQRFKRSLGKPFLMTFNRYLKLGGEVVEWRKRGDEIGVWVQPSVDPRRE